MKRRVLVSMIFAVAVLMWAPGIASASNALCPQNRPSGISDATWERIRDSEACQNQDDPIAGSGGLISDITNIVSVVAGIIAVVMIMYSGFKYITSSGESGAIEEAKKTLIFSVIGLIVIVLARTIILFVINRV